MTELARLLLLVLTCAVLWSLESGHRLRGALPNVWLTVILLLTNLLLSFVAASASAFVVMHRIGLLFLANVPVWVSLLLSIAALDLFAWVAHLAMHKSALGWRFHRVHHSDEHVDVTTAFRQHPGETLWRILWQLPAILLLGMPFWMVVVYLSVSAMNAQLEHANLALPEKLDRVLRLVFVTPNMHKVHHSRDQRETDTNYANIFSIWDRLFGTYAHRDLHALRYGLDDVEERKLRGLLWLPFA